MTQVAIYLAWYSLGLAVCVASGLGRRAAVICSAALVVGMACFVVLATLWLGLGLPYNRATALGLWAAPLGIAIAIAIVYRRPFAWRAAGACTIVAIALMVAACAINLANLTYDSHKIVALGRGIGYRGVLDDHLWEQLADWGSFQIIAHSTASLVGVSFLYALSPVVWLALVATFATGLWRGASDLASPSSATRATRTLAALVALVTLSLVSCFQFAHAATYIHNNLLSGALLFLFTLFFWLAQTEDDTSYLPVAFAALAALTFTRLETPFVAALFLILAGTDSRLPWRPVVIGLCAFVATSATWLLMLAVRLPPSGTYLTSRKAWLWIAVIAIAAGYVAGSHAIGRLRRPNRYLPVVAVALALLAVGATFALEPQHMTQSTTALWSNVTDRWSGVAWFGAVIALAAMIRIPAPPFSRAWRLGVPLFVASVVLLGFVRIPYRHSFWDSGNRMMLHVLPLLYFYIGIKLIPALLERTEELRGRRE